MKASLGQPSCPQHLPSLIICRPSCASYTKTRRVLRQDRGRASEKGGDQVKGDGIATGVRDWAYQKSWHRAGPRMERLSEQAPELLYIRNGHCYLEQQCKHHSLQAASLRHGDLLFSYRKVSRGLIRRQKDEGSSSIRFQCRLRYQQRYLANRTSRPDRKSSNRSGCRV